MAQIAASLGGGLISGIFGAQGGKAQLESEAAALASETARRQRRDDQASSGWGLATQTAANTLTPMAATAGGVIAGGKINKEMDLGQEGRNKTLRGAAADRGRRRSATWKCSGRTSATRTSRTLWAPAARWLAWTWARIWAWPAS